MSLPTEYPPVPWDCFNSCSVNKLTSHEVWHLVFTLGPLSVAQLAAAEQSVYLSESRTKENEDSINNLAVYIFCQHLHVYF